MILKAIIKPSWITLGVVRELSVGNFGCFWMLTRLLYQWYNVTIITWMLCWISVWPDIRHPPCKQVTVNIEYARSNAMPTNMNQYANMRSHFFCHYNNCEQNNLTEKKTMLSFFFYIYQDSQKFKYYFNHVVLLQWNYVILSPLNELQ